MENKKLNKKRGEGNAEKVVRERKRRNWWMKERENGGEIFERSGRKGRKRKSNG